MAQGHKILVVAQDPTLACQLVTWLAPVSHELVVVTTFAAAKVHLNTRPDVVITELKLREYNGLHLALRAQAAGIPAVVLGPTDAGFERQAEQLGAAYLASSDMEPEDLHALIQKTLDEMPETEHRSRWYDSVLTTTDTFVDARVNTPLLEMVAVSLGQRPVVVH